MSVRPVSPSSTTAAPVPTVVTADCDAVTVTGAGQTLVSLDGQPWLVVNASSVLAWRGAAVDGSHSWVANLPDGSFLSAEVSCVANIADAVVPVTEITTTTVAAAADTVPVADVPVIEAPVCVCDPRPATVATVAVPRELPATGATSAPLAGSALAFTILGAVAVLGSRRRGRLTS